MLNKRTYTETTPKNSTAFLVNQCLSQVSTEEIYDFINRLNFYLEHFRVININNNMKKQIAFLKKAKSALTQELYTRTEPGYTWCSIDENEIPITNHNAIE